jgi:hypothetical protein
MSVTVDERIAQREQALELANRVRAYRAQKRRAVAEGRLRLEDLLSDEACAGMPVGRALLSLRQIGQQRADWILARAHVAPTRRIGGLTERQREAILLYVENFPSQRAGR